MRRIHIHVEDDGFVSGWGDSEGNNEKTVGMYLPKDSPFFLRFSLYRINENGHLVYDESKQLLTAKEKKINILKEECSQRIVDGFEYMGYKFGFSTSDQSNITSTMMAMQMGITTEIEWTVRTLEGETARVTLDVDNFKEMAKVALAHKDDHIKYLRNVLEPKINACTTLQELGKITWEGEEE